MNRRHFTFAPPDLTRFSPSLLQVGAEEAFESGALPNSAEQQIHGVPTGWKGSSGGGTGRKYLGDYVNPPPDGGFKGVLSGAYSEDSRAPPPPPPADPDSANDQFSSNWPRPSPNRSKSPQRSLGAVAQAARFALNRQSNTAAPFATAETVKKVTETINEYARSPSAPPQLAPHTHTRTRTPRRYEGSLMKMGMESQLLKSELEKLGRERKTAGNMRRSREIEGIMETSEKEMSRLRRICKEKKDELGIS